MRTPLLSVAAYHVATSDSRAGVDGVHVEILEVGGVPDTNLPVGHFAELLVSNTTLAKKHR